MRDARKDKETMLKTHRQQNHNREIPFFTLSHRTTQSYDQPSIIVPSDPSDKKQKKPC